MTLTQQRQRLLVILFVLAIVLVFLLSFATFEIIQHLNSMSQLLHGLANRGPDTMSGHH